MDYKYEERLKLPPLVMIMKLQQKYKVAFESLNKTRYAEGLVQDPKVFTIRELPRKYHIPLAN